jgi:hypothetical protein
MSDLALLIAMQWLERVCQDRRRPNGDYGREVRRHKGIEHNLISVGDNIGASAWTACQAYQGKADCYEGLCFHKFIFLYLCIFQSNVVRRAHRVQRQTLLSSHARREIFSATPRGKNAAQHSLL